MNYNEFIKELELENKILAISLTNERNEEYKIPKAHCIMKEIDNLKKGEKLLISEENLKCPGGKCGAGYNDDLPDIKGGFGNFISHGKKSSETERYPKGEKIKKTPEIGEAMIKNQPKNVLEGFKYITIKHYEEGDSAETITIKTKQNQLSALVFLFNFEKSEYDNVYACMSAGCGSVLKIPLEEAKKDSGRGVIGNLDFVSRFFTNNELYFTIAKKEFDKILENAEDSFLTTSPWKNLKNKKYS